MRLVLSSASLRRARIVLLKSTHFGFVVAIRVYEGLCRRLAPARAISLDVLGPSTTSRSALRLHLGPLHGPALRDETPTLDWPRTRGRRRRQRPPSPASGTGRIEHMSHHGRRSSSSRSSSNNNNSSNGHSHGRTIDDSYDLMMALRDEVQKLNKQVGNLTTQLAQSTKKSSSSSSSTSSSSPHAGHE